MCFFYREINNMGVYYYSIDGLSGVMYRVVWKYREC